MNILENKRVVALSAVFALAFGGLVYYGYDRSQAFDAAKKELDSINEKVLDFEQSEYPPTNATRKAVKDATKKVEDTLKTLKADFAAYEAKCIGNGKVITSVDFTNQVRGAIDDIKRAAEEKGCKLSPAAEDLGFAPFKNDAAPAEEVPFRSFHLKAAKRVAEIVLASGAPLLDKVYCAPLPDPKLRKKAGNFPLSLEVAFEANRCEVEDGKTPVSVLPQVMNSLVEDKDFFFKVTGLWVGAPEESLPAMDEYKGATVDADKGDDLSGEAAPNQETEYRQIAVRKTGSPDEKVRVHINLQVIYFNSNTSKK